MRCAAALCVGVRCAHRWGLLCTWRPHFWCLITIHQQPTATNSNHRDHERAAETSKDRRRISPITAQEPAATLLGTYRSPQQNASAKMQAASHRPSRQPSRRCHPPRSGNPMGPRPKGGSVQGKGELHKGTRRGVRESLGCVEPRDRQRQTDRQRVWRLMMAGESVEDWEVGRGGGGVRFK